MLAKSSKTCHFKLLYVAVHIYTIAAVTQPGQPPMSFCPQPEFNYLACIHIFVIRWKLYLWKPTYKYSEASLPLN